MRDARLLWGLMGIWLLVYGLSFWVFFTTPATGDSFTRGLNKLAAFMQWQMGAGGVAIVIWIKGWRLVAGSRARWATRMPVLLALLPILGIVALIGIFLLTDGPAPPASTQMPATAPIAKSP